jgi:hypothetical protein
MRTTWSVLTLGILLVSTSSTLSAQDHVGQRSWATSRPVPYPIDLSNGFKRALERGTRSATGEPGPNYWQQWTDYTIRGRLDTEGKRIDGTVRMVYHNRSPRLLPSLALQLLQNVHAEGAMRNRPAEVTGGMEIKRITAQGRELQLRGFGAGRGDTPTMGTALQLRLPAALQSGDSAVLEVEFGFTIPQRGIGSRMGWSRDNLFYLAYWYPQMAVFDDVEGWQTDAFLGNAEFYMGYGSYDVTLEVPEGWVVMGTGRILNAEKVMPANIVARLRQAERSDTVVHVITAADFGPGSATQRAAAGHLGWHFVADSVRDVTYSITRESLWDATRTPVGDRNGDGNTDYARIDAIYRQTAPHWVNMWRYAQHSIDFLSRWIGYPYPWPHMTAVEGNDIMGGGMEYPMMTLIGGYTQAGDTALYGVTAHELAHMWVPMIVGNDERRTAWMDEGTTSFNTGAAEFEFYPGRRWDLGNYSGYIQTALSGLEGPMMRRSDFHYDGTAYGTASYSKPATMLWTLRGLLGEDVFRQAYHTYVRRWAFKHPMPWDFFNTFNDVSGQNLDWFWHTWYYETWTLDQAIAEVRRESDHITIVIEDRGLAPMPVRLTITTADGTTMKAEIPVNTWLDGARRAETVVRTTSPVLRVEIDAEQVFPDADRRNNIWERT